MDTFGAPLEVFRMHGRQGRFVVDMPIGEISRLNGADSYEVNRLRLSQTLAAMVGDDLRLGDECVSVDSTPQQAMVTFADGRRLQADVVIACDGANSVVRQFLHPDVALNMLGSGGWIAVIDQIPPGLPSAIRWISGYLVARPVSPSLAMVKLDGTPHSRRCWPVPPCRRNSRS